ncbi:MAG: ADOP family duplicated permease [Candidatus Sulfopaludibacter sp.]|nr:ADOP family duplicated permease [Candidatus Sulfopaludibacter sp.]
MSLWSRIANVFRNDCLSGEIDEELQSHIEEAVTHGRDPVEARRAFGSPLRQREASRDVKLAVWLDSLRADAVFGWRQLMKRKVTSAAAILSLALAIGACTAAFRLIDAMLWRPLPVSHPERLYVLAQAGIGPGGNWRISESSEYPLFRQLRAAVKDQAELLAISYSSRTDLTYGPDEEMEKAWRQYVSGWMFDSFGLKPAAGRLFTEIDDLTPGAHPVAVLSYDYWTRRFNKNPKAIGRTVRIDSTLYEIVGVAPEGFTGTEPGVGIDIFVPTMMNPYVTRSDASWFRPFVQLKPGVAAQPVLERLRVPFQANQEERSKDFKGRSRSVIANFLHQKLILEPAGSGTSDMQKDYRSALAALGVLVALVLLIACANVANLMMAQAAARAREMALRVSIGAGRWRLVQLVLVESAMLAVLAALVGGWFAWWAAPFVAGRIRPANDPAHLYLPADWRVLAFGLALTLCVTCLFGLAPALRASSVEPAGTLKGGDDPHSRRRTMHSLIALQVAFCFVVLFLAGLFVATSGRLSHQSTGFSSERLLTLDAVAARPQRQALWQQVADRLRAAPGVETVAISAWPLLSGNGSNGFIMLNGVPVNDTLAYFLGVSPGWLDTMRIPFVDGRDFRANDTSPNAAIVNQAFARTYFNGADPVGKWFERPQGTAFARYRIVGLVRDARYRNMREPITPTAYVPLAQSDPKMDPASETFIVRTASANPLALAQFLRRELPRARREFRVSNIRTQQELVEQQTIRERLLAMLGYFFAGVALLLAGIGLYGVLDYSVLQRRREIGIRMAIGAQAGQIARSVTADAFLMVLAGALAGLALGESLARYIASLLYQVKPGDAAMLVYPACLILAAALVAAVPAVIRAVRIDPIATLRQE